MSFTAQLPLNKTNNGTYVNIDDQVNFIKQNVKNVLLTNPGERIMIPDFGVGIKQYLFENFSEVTYSRIENKIFEQTEAYMPFIKIRNLDIQEGSDEYGKAISNSLFVTIEYFIDSLSEVDVLNLTVSQQNVWYSIFITTY